MKAKFKVVLKKPVTGKQIAAAVKELARGYYEELCLATDAGNFYEIGQASPRKYEDLIIGVGPNAVAEIKMDEIYNEAYVLSHSFPRSKIRD
jgi:hypothetical protein